MEEDKIQEATTNYLRFFHNHFDTTTTNNNANNNNNKFAYHNNNHGGKLTFVHIPKTGGTGIEAAAGNYASSTPPGIINSNKVGDQPQQQQQEQLSASTVVQWGICMFHPHNPWWQESKRQ